MTHDQGRGGPGEPGDGRPGWGWSAPGVPGAAVGGWGAPPGWGAAPDWGWAPPPPPKPGVVPLHPLSVGDMVGGALSAMGRYWKQLLGLAAASLGGGMLIMALALLVAYAVVGDQARALFDLPEGERPPSAIIRPLVIAFVSLWVVAAVVLTAALAVLYAGCTTVLREAVMGSRATFSSIWRYARARVPAVLGTMVLSGLAAFGPWILIMILVGVSILASAGSQSSPQSWLPGATIALALAVVPLCVWLYIRFSLAPNAAVFESQGPVAAMRRSVHLVRGSWWRTFGIGMLAALIAGAAGYVIQIPFTIVGVFAGMPGLTGTGPESTPGQVLAGFGTYMGFVAVGGLISQVVSCVFPHLVTGLIYVDRRIRLESLDLALAEATGTPLVPPPRPPKDPGPATTP